MKTKILQSNPYGFRLNINVPEIRDKYERYKKYKGMPTQFPCSDDERREFERYVLKEDSNGM